jgi:hypothetical protein
MENNVVELKFDRVNEYFEKFKKEYDAEYERNKTSGTRTIVPYHMLKTSCCKWNGTNCCLYGSLWFFKYTQNKLE